MPNPPSPDPPRGLHCATCNKNYSNLSHLRRHEATHTGRHSSSCSRCNKTFVRLDVARRHIRRCGDGDGNVLSMAKRGKKRRACDTCSKHKASCDGEEPCARCQSREITCSYVRRDDANSTTTIHPPPTNDTVACDSERIPIDFLLGIANPAAFSVSETLNRGVDDDTQDLELPRGLQSGFGSSMPEEQTLSWEAMLPPAIFTPSFELGTNEDDLSEHQHYATAPSANLVARMDGLVQELTKAHGLMVSNGVTSEPFDVKLANSVFTVENLAYFLCVYFRRAHVCHPIVHRPTFDCETAPLPLIAALFSFGSLYSAPVDHAISARTFLDIIEEFIFSQPTFRQRLKEWNSNDLELRTEDIGILQAALTIVVAQNGINNKTTRCRIRVDRHPRLNAVLRVFGVFAVKHQARDEVDSNAARWRKFIRDESCIRLATWAVLSDSFMAGFFNGAPQVLISEMLGDMTCRDTIFEAETAEHCLHMLSHDAVGPKPQSLAKSTSSLLFDTWVGPTSPVYKRLTSSNLLAIICALGTIAVSARTSFLIPSSANALLRACWRWKALWDTTTAREAGDQIVMRGFVKHALELWWLVATHVKVTASGDLTCEHMHMMPTDTTEGMNEFLERYKDT